MKDSICSLSFALMAVTAVKASSQTLTTPPEINWKAADVAIIYAADQEKYPDVFEDTGGNPANAWTASSWGQTCTFSDDEAGDGAALRIDDLDFLPMQFVKTLDISKYRYLHFDFWVSVKDSMSIKFQNFYPGEQFSIEPIELKGGEWTSIDIDLDGDNFQWTKKGEIPQHCINIIQLGGEKIRNDYPHAPSIYVTNIIAHNEGSVSGIENVIVVNEKNTDNAVYNIYGQRVSDSYRGIIITKGKKYLRR